MKADDKPTSHPSEAFWFAAEADMQGPPAAGSGPRKFSGTPYTGAVMSHPYWGQLAIDLATAKANPKVPALIQHDRGQRAGYCSLSIGNSIEVANGILLDNQFGQQVASESDQGFPWQMSIHADPGSIEDVGPGQKVQVNGNTMTGPGSIFRNTAIREVSFTPTGVDAGTSAVAFSTPYKQQHRTNQREEPSMDTTELEAKLAAAEADTKAANERAAKAEQALDERMKAERLSAVKGMFADLGREYSDDAAKAYLAMDEDTFKAVAADLRATKPAAGEHLFHAHAEQGRSAEQEQASQLSLNPADIYKKANEHGGAK